MYLTDGKQNIYLDFPYKSGAFNYMKYAKSEVDSIKKMPFLFLHIGMPIIIRNDWYVNWADRNLILSILLNSKS